MDYYKVGGASSSPAAPVVAAVSRGKREQDAPATLQAAKPDEAQSKQKIVAAILDKHDAATHTRRFDALLATPRLMTPSSITRYS